MIKKIDWKWSTLIVAIILNFGFGAMWVGETKREIKLQSDKDYELTCAIRELTKELKITREEFCELKGQMKIK